jgi:hypothetical protein
MVVRLEDGESVVMVPAERPPDRTPMSDSQHRMLRHLADWAHLDRSQRLELASMVLNRQVGTWRYLSCFEASRLIDHLQGYLLINQVHNTPVPEPSKTLRRSSRSDR